jgi:hypothetical protein
MGEYGGSGYKDPSFVDSVLIGGEWSASRLHSLTSGERALVPTGYKVRWTPEPTWMISTFFNLL